MIMLRYKLIAKSYAPAIIILALTFLNAFAWYSLGTMQAYSKQSETYRVCQAAHKEISGRSEELCGRLQDETKTEFICGSYDCWLEVK